MVITPIGAVHELSHSFFYPFTTTLSVTVNTWDRLPFLTNVKSGGNAYSYEAALTETSHSMIIANYGASQGEDNDDGSSWNDVHDNFFYDASGFKMDFGK